MRFDQVGTDLIQNILKIMGFPGGSAVKNPPAGDVGSIPESGGSVGGGNGNSLQFSCLGNPRTEEPGRLQSMGSQRIVHDLVKNSS